MGAISGLLGTAGGASGSGFAAPAPAQINPGATTAQTNTAYGQNQTALGNQAALLAALQAQNGTDIQNNAVNRQAGLTSALGESNGVGNLNNALASQQQLVGQQKATANQLQGIANGTGPNPAQAMLNQQTGQNVANTSALMAGQRGAGANVGLIARQAGQQGAATQQQAVGQGATMQANQSLNALGALSGQQQAIGNTQQNIAGIAGQQIGAQQTGINSLTGQGNQIAGQQIGATSANTGAQQSEQQVLQNALASANSAQVGSQGSVNAGNSALAGNVLEGQKSIIGSAANSIATGLGAPPSMATGGEIGKQEAPPKKMAYGDPDVSTEATPTAQSAASVVDSSQPQSPFGQFLQNLQQNREDQNTSSSPQNSIYNSDVGGSAGDKALGKGFGKLTSVFMGNSPASSSPSSSSLSFAGADDASGGGDDDSGSGGGGAASGIMSILPIAALALAAKGGKMENPKKQDYRRGGNVKAKTPQEKAVKAGNSYDNDKVPALLSEGEVVIPRSIMQSKDPVRGAADFVMKVMAKRTTGRKGA